MKKYPLYPLIVLSMILVTMVGCMKRASGPETEARHAADSVMAANKAVTQKAYDIFNAKDYSKLDEVIAADFVEHNPDPGQAQGIEGLRETFERMKVGFPDYKFIPDKLLADGDMVTVHFTMTGTNTGSMIGMPPTNKVVNFTGFDMMRIKDGKAVEHWGCIDYPTMMQQLGLMPLSGAEVSGGKTGVKPKS